jgi:hypothetical protein
VNGHDWHRDTPGYSRSWACRKCKLRVYTVPEDTESPPADYLPRESLHGPGLSCDERVVSQVQES